MIFKFFEINKINFNVNKIILFYGKNRGLKNETISNLINSKSNVLNYDEKEILENPQIIFEKILSKSLFEDEKIIIIKRASDKIMKIINEINLDVLDDITIFIDSENLEKRSKLRLEFEKNKKLACIAFYPENHQSLLKLASNFLQKRKIMLSTADINLIISRCDGDREYLLKELEKIWFLSLSQKRISSEDVAKLTNLSENHSISLLVDYCLAKNKKSTINILNENNFTNDDCVIITRIFLSKSKKILGLILNYSDNKNIELTISSARPPIFWKDKEITKEQILKWSPQKIKMLIYKLNELELLIKKNVNNSINLVKDFILEQVSIVTSNKT